MSSKVRCATCKKYIDKSSALRLGIQSFCDSECEAGRKWFKPATSTLKSSKPLKAHKKGHVPLSEDLWQEVMKADAHHCRFCGSRWDLHVHHVIYRSEQGKDEKSNLLTLCTECHMVVHSNKKKWQAACLGVLCKRELDGDQSISVPEAARRLEND